MQQTEESLSERWQLVEKIDEGAMGEIFRGRHALLGHEVAIKVLVPTASRDRSANDRFLREARIAAKLQHRNIVRVEDFGIATDGRPFLVMQLLRGESLARRMTRVPTLTHAETLDIVRQIAAGVDTAHSAGIIHRDLKPENVFLANEDDRMVVKVLDFGVAKFTDVLANGAGATASNTLIGTPRYMSPEQARSSRELDGRSDLWSLAMIAYEMLTGTHPFQGEAIAELLVAILTTSIVPPSCVRPELPQTLDVWVDRALARSRYHRFGTGLELVNALSNALEGRLEDGAHALDERSSARKGVKTLRTPRVASATLEESSSDLQESVRPARTNDPTPATPIPATPVDSPTPQPSQRSAWWLAVAAALLASIGWLSVRQKTQTSQPPPAREVAALHPASVSVVPLPPIAAPQVRPVEPLPTEPKPVVPTVPARVSSSRVTRPRPEVRRRPGVVPVLNSDHNTPTATTNRSATSQRLYDPTGI
jgi:eukaryotic-like serine/threonine-protein kinase